MIEKQCKYIIKCQICGFNKMINNSNDIDMKLVNQAPIPSIKIEIDDDYQVVKKSTSISRPKMIKCPSCGRGVMIRPCNVNKSKHIIEEERKNESKD